MNQEQAIEKLTDCEMDGFITGLGRDEKPPAVAHIYQGTFNDPGDPLCPYGWNRDNGNSYSIFRNNIGRKGICKICLKKLLKDLLAHKP